DPTGAALLDELRAYDGTPVHDRSPNGPDAADLLVPIHVRKADCELRLFCTFMTLGTPQDVTLQELRIETFFPADDESARVWESIAEGAPPVQSRGAAPTSARAVATTSDESSDTEASIVRRSS